MSLESRRRFDHAGAVGMVEGQLIQPEAIDTDSTVLWPMAIYFACVAGVAAFMVVFSAVLGQRHKERATGDPYESGIVSFGSARIRLSIRFYLVAMFFLIFDLEAVFIFTWAVAARELGWPGYISITVFIGILIIALLYLWRLGGLEWGPRRGRRGFAREGCMSVNESIE